MPHTTDPNDPTDRADLAFYRISLIGRLQDDLFDLFSPMHVQAMSGHTVMLGPVEDQAALQGLLTRIQSLGLELEEVKRVRTYRRGDTRVETVAQPSAVSGDDCPAPRLHS